jgi:hypothetical protein
MKEEQLDRLVRGSRRANKVLAKRRLAEAEQQKTEERRKENLRLRAEYSDQLRSLALENGVLTAAEKAAAQRGGTVTSNMRFYIHQGLSTCCVDPSLIEPEIGELRPSFLSLLINWQEGDDTKEVHIKMDRRQWINLQDRFFSIPPFIWRRNMPKSLDDLIEDAIRKESATPATEAA